MVFVRSRLARAVLLFEKTFSPLERPLFCLFYKSHEGSPHPAASRPPSPLGKVLCCRTFANRTFVATLFSTVKEKSYLYSRKFGRALAFPSGEGGER